MFAIKKILTFINFQISLFTSFRHVGVFEVRGKNFRLKEKIRLQTVRPFYIKNITLGETNLDPQNDEQVMCYITEQVSDFLY